MTYMPQIGSGGYVGWKLLQRTAEVQRDAVSRDPEIQRMRNYFDLNFNKVDSADDLISDFKLLKVVLTAYNLEHDTGNKFLIKKILESNTSDSSSLANRMSNKNYLALSKVFDFYNGDGNTQGFSTSPAEIFSKYIDRIFNNRIGAQDGNLGLALSARQELSDLSRKETGMESFWFKVLSSTEMKTVFEGAFSIPSAFGRLSIDRQHAELMMRSEKMFGSADPETFSDPGNVEKLIRNFLLRSQVNTSINATPYSTALSILGNRS